MNGQVAGVGTLLALYVKRDRIKLPAWIIGICFFVFYFSFTVTTIYPTPADMRPIAEMIGGTAFGAFMTGPGYGMNDIDAARMLVHVYGIEFLIAVGIMNVLLVARHLRGDEETARGELLRAGAVPRHAAMTAVLLLAIGANAVLAVLMGVSTMALGHAPMPSLLFGASVGAAGLAYAGLTAIACQFAPQAGAAAMIGGAVLAATMVMRGIGDMMAPHGNWLSWLSPIGWSQQTRAFVDDRWWPLLLAVLAFVLSAALAYWLLARRDFGAGMFAPRPGRDSAPAWLRSPWALAWRQRRRALAWWAICFVLAGLVYGGLGVAMMESLETFTMPENFLGDAESFGTDLYIGLISDLIAIIAGIFVLVSMGQVKNEENRGLADPVLVAPVRRPVYFAAHTGVILTGVLVLLFAAGAVMGVTSAMGLGQPELVGVALVSLLARFPELAALTAIAAALYGLRPQWMFIGWISLIYGVAMTFFLPGGLGAPAWVHLGSPFGLIPRVPPFENFDAPRWFGLLGIAALLGLAGSAGFRRRDIP